MKLKVQLAAASAISILFAIIIISLSSYFFINREFRLYRIQLQEKEALEHAHHLQNQYDEAHGSWNREYVHGFGMYALNEGYIIKLRDASGNMVWDAENHDMAHCHEIMASIREKMQRYRESGDGDFVVRSYPLTVNGIRIGTAEISFYAPYYFGEDEFQFIDSLNIILLIAGIGALLFSIIVAFFISKRLSAPIERAITAATEISNGNYLVKLDSNSRISETRLLSQSIDNMAQLLAHKEKLQQRLISDVAHELRTPIANVSAQLETMSEGIYEPTPERLELCHNELNRLTGLVNDLQSLKAIEQDVDASKFVPVNCRVVLKHVTDLFEPELKKKNILCDSEVSEAIIMGEEARLIQLFSNILSNSIKYTPENGSINIRTTIRDHQVQIAITDTGIGISQEDIPFIFERFYRTDKSRTRKSGGAGIGLTIARAIAKSHGGDIKVISTPGAGSTFTVILPLSSPAKEI